MTGTKSYSELISFSTFLDRYRYLKLGGRIGEETFGFDRYLNQALYKSPEWRRARDEVIIRDNGCDLGLDGYEIYDKILIHHINPITRRMIQDRDPEIFDLENLICVSHNTHNAIHYGDESLLPILQVERYKGDTKLW